MLITKLYSICLPYKITSEKEDVRENNERKVKGTRDKG
jgi:hypothetical protein